MNHVDAVDGSEYLDTELRPGAASAALADPVTRADPDNAVVREGGVAARVKLKSAYGREGGRRVSGSFPP